MRNDQIPHCRFTVFTNNHEQNSIMAVQNLTLFCRRFLLENYSIETVDVTQDIDRALDAGIMVTPTILAELPHDTITLFGTLQDTTILLDILGIKGEENE